LRPTEPVVTLTLVRKSEGIDFRQLHAIADKLQPKLKRTVLQALNQLDEPAQAALMAAIESGQMDRIMAQLAGTMGDDAAGQIASVYREVFTGAANLQGAEFDLKFDIANPRAVRWAEQNAAKLVTSVNSQTRNALRDIVVRGIQDGMAPRVQAREMRQLIGLSRRDATAADNFLRGMLDDGLDEDQALRRFGRYRDKLLRARAETIARTETIRAANMGQRAAWDAAADGGLLQRDTLRLVWIATEDSRTCPICSSLDGKTVGFDESFRVPQQDPNAEKQTRPPVAEKSPPAHPRCRCALGLVEGGDSEEQQQPVPKIDDIQTADDAKRWFSDKGIDADLDGVTNADSLRQIAEATDRVYTKYPWLAERSGTPMGLTRISTSSATRLRELSAAAQTRMTPTGIQIDIDPRIFNRSTIMDLIAAGDHSVMSTMLHEYGHVVHYSLGHGSTPNVLMPYLNGSYSKLKRGHSKFLDEVSLYADSSRAEYVAEMFQIENLDGIAGHLARERRYKAGVPQSAVTRLEAARDALRRDLLRARNAEGLSPEDVL
jgi:hypothetical protein